MQDIEQKINRVWDIAVYLQMMAAFCNDLDFNEYSELMLEIHKNIKESDEKEIWIKLPKFEKQLNDIARPIKLKYKLKRDYREIAKDWNEKHKIDKDIFSNGIMIGWLEEQIDLSNYYPYDYTPYQFKVGLVIHKGRGEIVYIGKGIIKQRAKMPERKDWDFEKIEYSIIDDNEEQLKWEDYWIERYKHNNHGKKPIYNIQSGVSKYRDSNNH